jgi:hypothetical protein
MKTTYSFLLLALLGNGLLAQPSLEFSQVRLITAEETVPTGKVWKVEAALGPATSTQQNSNTLSTTPTLPSSHIILVNGQTTSIAPFAYLGSSITGTGNTSGTSLRLVTVGKEFCTSFPFWLPEGATLEASTNVNAISVIEFTITN